jgi:hypothetical protein
MNISTFFTENFDRIEQICEDNEVQLYNGYSGRGMYGSTCFGITGSHRDCTAVIADIITAYVEEIMNNAENTNRNDLPHFIRDIMNYRQDSMGLDTILYWQKIKSISVDNEEAVV